ncbi:DUF4919 domain-containing protein [Flavobacterium sp.]|uniref:DUF4919 domain-containing protein n=1 Tax=Flavobacterium sp. TaxID=239 RepID=UPI003527B6E7
MKVRIFVITLFCFTLQALGQIELCKPDFVKIQAEVTKKSSKYYLPKLLERFNNPNVKLSEDELHYLYFGYRMVEPYKALSLEEKANKLKRLSLLPCEKVVEYCDELLKTDPFDLDYLKTKHSCQYELTNNQKQSEDNFKFYYSIFMTMRKTGCGTRASSPIYVLDENHIATIINTLGYKPSGNKRVENNLLIVEVNNNFFKNNELYFDITLMHQQKFDANTMASKSVTNTNSQIATTEKATIQNDTTVEKTENITNVTHNTATTTDIAQNNNSNIVTKVKVNSEVVNEVASNETVSTIEDSKEEIVEEVLDERALRIKEIEEIRAKRAQEAEERRLLKQQMLKEREEMRKKLIEDRKREIEERRKAIEENRGLESSSAE